MSNSDVDVYYAYSGDCEGVTSLLRWLMLTLFINVSFSLTRNSWQGIGFGRLCVTYNACYDVAVFVTIQQYGKRLQQMSLCNFDDRLTLVLRSCC